ncbi:MAG: DUF3293 domain-containing protein [Chitinophagaceae bacterium]
MITVILKQAYQKTSYFIFDSPIVIRIGQHNAELESLLKQHTATSWAFITAYNPYSKELTDEENKKRHFELVHVVSSYTYFEGEGVGEDENWKPEKSLLILEISKDDAMKIGKQFGQNAIVFGKEGGVAELLLLK